MNITETMQIMAVLELAYPQFYAKKTNEEKKNAVKLWTEMFADEPGEVVAMAVKALIKTRVSDWPPSIGAINEKIMQITQPKEMTELEAWESVAKAIRNSAYNSGEEFAKLPEVVQRLVGTPAQLREWAVMDSDTINSVVASNFQRSYKARAKHEREYLALPTAVKGFMNALADKMDMQKRLEAGN